MEYPVKAAFQKRSISPFPAPGVLAIVPPMPRGRKKDPANMTAAEELRSLLQWAEQMKLENVAAALRRVLSKLP